MVDTADRINLEQPRLPVFAYQVPPPSDAPSPHLDSSPTAHAMLSAFMLAVVVAVAFFVAGWRP